MEEALVDTSVTCEDERGECGLVSELQDGAELEEALTRLFNEYESALPLEEKMGPNS